MSCNFSISHYQEIIRNFQKDHQFIFFDQAKKTQGRFVILRHDIDYSLKKALKMAQIDKSLNIKATFFILISCPYYNLFEIKSLAIIKQICLLGHQIGLHYDGAMIENLNISPQIFLKNTVKYLEKIIQTKIAVLAQHNPAETKKIILPTGYLDAYSTQFTHNIKYLSDSCQKWHDGCLCRMSEKYPQLQILIHPYLWSEKSLKLDQLRRQVTKEKIQEFKDWERFFKKMNIQRNRQISSKLA